jgi:hypothetical protein
MDALLKLTRALPRDARSSIEIKSGAGNQTLDRRHGPLSPTEPQQKKAAATRGAFLLYAPRTEDPCDAAPNPSS